MNSYDYFLMFIIEEKKLRKNTFYLSKFKKILVIILIEFVLLRNLI